MAPKKRKINKPDRKARATTYDDAKLIINNTFRHNPHKRYTVKNLLKLTNALKSEDKENVREIVDSLRRSGVVDYESGKFRLNRGKMETYEGTVDMTSSGTLYVMVDGMEHDIRVNPQNAGHALHGDTVRAVIIRSNRAGNPEGEVIEVVRRSPKNYVGIVEISGKYAFIKVDSRKVPNDIFVPLRDLKGAEDGQKVVVRVVEWPEGMKNPQGDIVDVLGQAGDNNVEMHAILAEFDLPYVYPKEVEEAADRIPEKITKEEIAKRKDLRGIATFTIDPADAKDFDDALSIQKLPNGNYEVGVHIADVTHYVQPGSIIDTEGENRATSVYLVDRTVPMLPERLSNYLCSLRPNEEKLCFSAVFEITVEAEVLSEWFGRTVILSDRRFTYEEAQQVIETGEGDYKDEVLALNKLARTMRAERFRNGSINFDSEEAKFVLDATGKPVSVYFKEMKESNQLIEEFMLLANKKVAEFVGKKRPGNLNPPTFVYRVHDKPNSEKLGLLSAFAGRFGYKLRIDENSDVPKELNHLLSDIHGKSEENIISTLAIRAMAKAIYSTDNIGHYGLAFPYYTHFTSPIRRYPDMMVHRLLANYIAGGKPADKEHYEMLCEHSSDMEVRAADAERASIKYKMVEFMLDKIGGEFDGHISGITEWGIYVELDETKIEGMVALRDMTDDTYRFVEEDYAAVGVISGRRFTLGDGVRIRVARADLARKQLDFGMVASYDFDTKKATPVESKL